MTTITKDQIFQAVKKLPPEMLEEAWLLLEFLSYKATQTNLQVAVDNPEGAFPELDMSLSEINAVIKNNQLERLNRLFPDS